MPQEFVGDVPNSPAKHHLQYFYDHKIDLLKKISGDFSLSSSLTPKIGLELEFYLTAQDGSQIFDAAIIDKFIADLSKKFPSNFLIYQIEKEQGNGQIEIKTSFDSDLMKVCYEIEQIKLAAKKLAFTKQLKVTFAAQPFNDDCGSALQFNISLHDQSGENIFNFDEKTLHKSVGGLLQKSDEMMVFLAPEPQDYTRFSKELNYNLFKKGKYSAPINLSFGADNRTCAIRIPTAKEKRLEYRIAASNADAFLCCAALLAAILFGLQNELEPLKQIHGNAFDEQYQISDFCRNFDQAKEKFFSGDYLFRILSTTLIGNKI